MSYIFIYLPIAMSIALEKVPYSMPKFIALSVRFNHWDLNHTAESQLSYLYHEPYDPSDPMVHSVC